MLVVALARWPRSPRTGNDDHTLVQQPQLSEQLRGSDSRHCRTWEPSRTSTFPDQPLPVDPIEASSLAVAIGRRGHRA